MMKKLVVTIIATVFTIVTLSVWTQWLGYAGAPAPLSVQYGVQQLSHGQRVNFPTPFSTTPVVLTSAQIGGKAVSSAAVNLAPAGFLLYLTDDRGQSVSNAWVQWIAFVPSASKAVIGGVITASSGQRISFPTLSATPVIVTNAQKGGKALISGAVNNARNGFDLALVDDRGNGVSGAWLLWMAVVPSAQNGFKGEVRLRNDRDNVSFTPPFPLGPGYVLSAQPDVIAGAVNNRTDGFTLSLIRQDGSGVRNAWTQWLGYAGGITVGGPDLIIEDISWTPNPTSYASFTVKVKNQGNADARTFSLSLTTSGQNRTASVSVLAAGQTLTLNLTPSVRFTSPGNYSVQATADAQNQVTESNEGNNSLSKTLNIPVAPPHVVYLGMNKTLYPPFNFGETGSDGIIPSIGGADADPASGKARSHVEVVGSMLPRSADKWAKVGETFRVEQGSFPNTSCNATIVLNYHWNGYLSSVATGRSEAWIYGFATGMSYESEIQHFLKEWIGYDTPSGSGRTGLRYGSLAAGNSYTIYLRMKSYGLVTLGTVITDFYASNRGAFLDSIEIIFP